MANETLTADEIRRIIREENSKNIEQLKKQQESIDFLYQHIQNGSTEPQPAGETKQETNAKVAKPSVNTSMLGIITLAFVVLGFSLSIFQLLRSDINRFENSMQMQFQNLREETLERFNAIDQRFNGVDQRFNAIEQRLDQMNERIDDIYLYLIRDEE